MMRNSPNNRRRPLLLIIFLLVIGRALSQPADTAITPLTGQAGDYLQGYTDAYYRLAYLNRGLPPAEAPINLLSPQAAMEHFLLSAREGKFGRAAYALNLNLLPEAAQSVQAADLARMLYYLLENRLPPDWDELSDRPDAQLDYTGPAGTMEESEPRRSVAIGALPVNDRDITFSLQRVKVGEEPPVWVVSAATVENIRMLYDAYGPSWVSERMPGWANTDLLGVAAWKWVGLILLLLVCAVTYALLRRWLGRMAHGEEPSWRRDIGRKGATPISLAVAALALYWGIHSLLPVAGPYSDYIDAFLLIIVVGTVIWVILRAIDYSMDLVTDRRVGDISKEENAISRRNLTHISVARRVITFVVIIVGIAVVLAQFDSLQRVGLSLMASAGIATVVLGIAAQSTLGNIIAGLQIALTQPARIGDKVFFEGEYGTIENIRFTYLVISTWDARRIIVPLRYFITHPFENWSLSDPHLVKPISIFADPTTDVEKVRTYFEKIVEEDEAYDGNIPPRVQVVDSTRDAIEIRCLCSARDAPSAWHLHCRLREKLIAYISRLNDGRYLARGRVELSTNDPASAPPAGENGHSPAAAPRREESPKDLQ